MKHRKPNRQVRVQVVNELDSVLAVNPFVSEAQRRACYSQDDPAWDCTSWSAETPKDIPKRLSARAKKKLARNRGKHIPLGKLDPSRTLGLRRQFCQKLKSQFDELKGSIVKLVGTMDGFGLAQRQLPTENCAPGQTRGADGRCGHGVGLGIARDDMPQIPSNRLQEFVKYTRQQGVGVAEETVQSDSLQPIQSEFRQERVDAIPDDIATREPVIVSSDSRILDGTHRWLKIRQRGSDTIKTLRLGCGVDDALDLMRRFVGTKYATNANPEGCNQYTGPGCDSGSGKEFTPKVHIKDDPKLYGKHPGEIDLRSPNGAPLRGTPISPDDPRVPDEVYHMTTNLPAVLTSGHLRAAGEGGLGGDKSDQIVSMTTDREIARQLVKDMKWASKLAKEVGSAPKTRWDDEKTEWDYGGRPTWGKKLVEKLNDQAVKEGWSYSVHPLQQDSYNLSDHLHQYFSTRERKTGTKDPQIWDAEKVLPNLDADKIGMVRIPRENLKTGAMLTDFDLSNSYGLKEVRLYGDVPLDKSPISNERYQPFVVNGSTSYFPSGSLPDSLVEVPDIRQSNHWRCGAAETTAVLRFYGHDISEDQATKLLGTNIEKSTRPRAIIELLQSFGLKVESREGMTLADLDEYHRRGWPVIVCVQDYMGRRDPRATFDYGHYLTVIGRGYGYTFAHDPSLENWEHVAKDAAGEGGDTLSSQEQDGNIDAAGRIMVRDSDWLDVWHDVTSNGKKLYRFGIAVGPEQSWFVGNSNPEGCNQYKTCGGDSSQLYTVASSVIKDMIVKWGEKQGAEPGITPKECNEGWCSLFANSAVRAIQQRLGRDVTVAGKANNTEDVHTSRTDMDESGEGHMWVTVGGKHFDPEVPDGVENPLDLPWFRRHEGFHVTNANPEGCNQHTGPGCSAHDSLVEKHVQDSASLSTSERNQLRSHILRSKTSKSRLERVADTDEKHEDGDIVDLAPKSFTAVQLLDGDSADHIVVKYSDNAVYVVDHPSRGHDVDYGKINTRQFSAAAEKETILAGKYRVAKVNSVEHPGRMGKLKVYHLSELPTNNSNPEGCNQHTGPDCSTSSPSEKISTARQRLNDFQTKLDAATDVHGVKQVKAAGKFLGKLSRKLYDKLEGRYGRTTAVGIMLSGQAMGWGALGAGTLVGVPLWLPGSTLWGSLPAIAMAEVGLQTYRAAKKLTKNANDDQPRDDQGRWVTLYRGMSQEKYAELKRTGVYQPSPHNPHNDASTDLETAKLYADSKYNDDVEGVVVKFRAPVHHVKEDEVYKGDYKVIHSIDVSDHEVIHRTPTTNADTDAETKRVVEFLHHALVKWVKDNDIEEPVTNADVADTNCGTGAGGFQPGNTCGSLKGTVKFKGEDVDAGQPGIRAEITKHLHQKMRDIADEVEKLDRANGSPEDYMQLHRKQQELLSSDLSKAVGFKPGHDDAEDEHTAPSFPGKTSGPRAVRTHIPSKLAEDRESQVGSTHETVLAAQAGDQHALEKVLRENHGMVHKLARKYVDPKNPNFDDLIQQGQLGIIRAVQKFDKDSENKFGTYAWHWVKKKIQTEAAKFAKQQKTERSIDVELGGDDGRTRKQLEPVAREEARGADPEQLKELRDAIGKHLTPRERDIMERRLGMGAHEPHTQEEVAKFHGVTGMRISQIEKAAYAKLKKVMSENSLQLVRNTVFANHADAAKIEAFQKWLRDQLNDLVRGKTQEQLWDAYIRQGFTKGAGRAFDDTKKPFTNPKYSSVTDPTGLSDFYKGSREEFLRSAFGQPVAREKVQLLAARSFDELENVTEDMSNKMSRVLTDGLVEGKSPHEVAKDMVDEVDISRKRAEVVARTEIIRVHAEGQLVALKHLGVRKLGVAVEWTTSGLNTVDKHGRPISPCEKCSALESVILSIDAASGLIPLHPDCKCCFTPANVDEDDEDQITDADEIQSAFDEAGIDRVAQDAPEGILNAFCPTGPGGGVDPTCPPHQSIQKMKHYHVAHWLGQQGYSHEQVKGALQKLGMKATDQVVRFQMKAPKRDVKLSKDEQQHLHDLAGGKSPSVKPIPVKEKPDAGRTTSSDRGRSETSRSGPAQVSRPVARAPERPADTGASVARQPDRESADKGLAQSVPVKQPVAPTTPAEVKVVPASVEQANTRIDRYQRFFESRGNHEVAGFLGKLREHVNAVGTDEALKSLGKEVKGAGREVEYEGSAEDMSSFCRSYLDRYGISTAHSPGSPLISSASPKFGGTERDTKGSFSPKDPTLKDKLAEAKALPGLEKSEDISKLVGKDVTHLTPDVMKKLDDHYGKGQWIVKPYSDDAYAGHGIFFPQRAENIRQDATSTIHGAESEIAKHGFRFDRDKDGTVVGIQNENGDKYAFNSPHYKDLIYGHVREWSDRAAGAAANERGAALFDREGNVNGKGFMAQPAFKAVGVSDAERAAGKTIAPGEARVHIITRDGRAEIVPHSTWIKGEHLPVVFESDDTKAMAKAAQDAINRLPASERQGQIYAPDIIKAEGGYRVVEANPANDTGSSGYLGDNPFIIDSYVSHLTGREPAHVKFLRQILTDRAGSVAEVRRLEKVMARNIVWFIVVNANPESCRIPSGQAGGGQFSSCGAVGVGGEAHVEGLGKVKIKAKESGEEGAEHNQPDSCPPPCDRPSKPNERTPGSPRVLKFREPPPKVKRDANAPLRPSGDDSQTRIGDLGEVLARELGFRSVLPDGKRSFTAAERKKKGSSIDLEWGFSGKLYELKCCATTSSEYRLKAKESEKKDKLKYAKKVQCEAYTMVGVIDKDAGTLHLYASKEPGMVGAEVSEKKFNFVGMVKYSRED